MTRSAVAVLALALAPALAGCLVTEERRRAEQRRADAQACLDYGFRPGTDAFANCRLQLDQARLDRERAALRAPPDRRIFILDGRRLTCRSDGSTTRCD